MARLILKSGKRLASGYTALYRMDEGTGTTITDKSSNGYTGTFGAGAAQPTWTTGGLGFTTDDYVTIGNTGTVCKTLTIAFYAAEISKAVNIGSMVNLTANPGATCGCTSAGVFHTTQTDEIIGIWSGLNNSTCWCDASATIPAGWHMVTYVWNGTVYEIWVDGAKKTTTAATGGHAGLLTITKLLLGCKEYNNTLGTFFAGTIAFVVLYPRSLTDSEIRSNRAYIKSYLKNSRGVTLS